MLLVLEHEDGAGVGGLERLELTAEQQVDAGGGVGDRVELDGVEVDLAAPPVVVAHESGDRVLAAAVELERPGADRLLVEGRVGSAASSHFGDA